MCPFIFVTPNISDLEYTVEILRTRLFHINVKTCKNNKKHIENCKKNIDIFNCVNIVNVRRVYM